MNNLFKANIYRLKKSITFWILLVIMSFFGVFLYLNNYSPNCTNALGDIFFNYIIMTCLLLPIFISMFIGEDYNSNTIKNKIISGYKRKNIYLSNLFISVMVGLIYSLTYIIFTLIIANIYSNDFDISISKLIYLLCDTILINISLSSIFIFITMLIKNKSTSSIISLSITIWSLLFTSNLSYKISISSGINKTILQFIYDFIPLGQSYQIASLTDNYLTIAIYSIITTIVINILGIHLFNKENLN